MRLEGDWVEGEGEFDDREGIAVRIRGRSQVTRLTGGLRVE